MTNERSGKPTAYEAVMREAEEGVRVSGEIDPHFRDHDPILDAAHCERCNAALRHTFVLLADMDLGPKDAVTLANQIRRIALGIESVPDRPIEDVVAPQFTEVDADIDIPLPPR